MRTSHSSRVVALAIGVSIVCGTVALLESCTGCLGLVLVALFTHLFGRNIGSFSAAFVSTGIIWDLIGPPHNLQTSSSITRSFITLLAACLCAELVSRRRRKPASTARMTDDPFDLPIQNLANELWSRTIDGQLEYVCPSIYESSGLTFEELNDGAGFTHRDDIHVLEQTTFRGEAVRKTTSVSRSIAPRSGASPANGLPLFVIPNIYDAMRWSACMV
jgi:hypothetical protein